MVTSAEKSGYLDLPADWLSEYAIAPTMSSAVNDKIPLIPQLLSQDHQNFILSPYQVIARLFARQWLPDDDRFCR
ncbi:MAG: hypothetical protein KFF72_08225 [Arthrospira sp. SH-MAG29]|nr:hypothetical protein [Arthrospira sp. SH-MAG29]